MLTEKSCSCPSKSEKAEYKTAYPILSSTLITLIPKCNFHILTYSNAIILQVRNGGFMWMKEQAIGEQS
jgi:hypothetical protein